MTGEPAGAAGCACAVTAPNVKCSVRITAASSARPSILPSSRLLPNRRHSGSRRRPPRRENFCASESFAGTSIRALIKTFSFRGVIGHRCTGPPSREGSSAFASRRGIGSSFSSATRRSGWLNDRLIRGYVSILFHDYFFIVYLFLDVRARSDAARGRGRAGRAARARGDEPPRCALSQKLPHKCRITIDLPCSVEARLDPSPRRRRHRVQTHELPAPCLDRAPSRISIK
jgi:hypothetical protein